MESDGTLAHGLLVIKSVIEVFIGFIVGELADLVLTLKLQAFVFDCLVTALTLLTETLTVVDVEDAAAGNDVVGISWVLH